MALRKNEKPEILYDRMKRQIESGKLTIQNYPDGVVVYHRYKTGRTIRWGLWLDEVYRSYQDWVEQPMCVVSMSQLKRRIEEGMSVRKAITHPHSDKRGVKYYNQRRNRGGTKDEVKLKEQCREACCVLSSTMGVPSLVRRRQFAALASRHSLSGGNSTPQRRFIRGD